MITDEQLAQWRALVDAATPGPWSEREDSEAPAWRVIWSDDYSGLDVARVVPWMTHVEFNAAFIAAAREAVPALLDEVERLRRVETQLVKHWTLDKMILLRAADERCDLSNSFPNDDSIQSSG
jgi:hypothetical protein